MAEVSLIITISLLSFFFFTTLIHQSSSARVNPPDPTNSLHSHKITFIMQNILTNSTNRPNPTTTNQLPPFSKPLGIFPPSRGIPILPTRPSKTLDLSNNALFFPDRASVQELEFGSVQKIEEELYQTYYTSYGSVVIGKAEGVYIACSEKGRSYMMAMTALFADTGESKSGLRFFGVWGVGSVESHVAVIGGVGKYEGANGYATVKAVDLKAKNSMDMDNYQEFRKSDKKLLLFTVYLS